MTKEELFRFCFPADEKPLDRIPEDGGFCAILRRIAVVGDSLSSGEFETKIPGENTHYDDFFEYSWGQFLARLCGSEVLNFSRGGMTAREYCKTFAASRDLWNPAHKVQAYIIALGVNDLQNCHHPLGSVADICREDWRRNADTYAGRFAEIVQRYKEITPDAKFFFLTMPEDRFPQNTAINRAHQKLMHEMAAFFPNCYVIDLLEYSPANDYEFRGTFYMHGHLTPCGYYLYAKLIAAYIDWIIRHNLRDFDRVGYVNRELCDTEYRRRIAAYEAKKAEEAAKKEN